MKILIVDDLPENLYCLRELLQSCGYEVDEARHGAEALVKARQSPPQIIISDLLMPVMDGYSLLRQWKADPQLKQIPFVVYTATYTGPMDEKLALDSGADAFILKPLDADLFMARIREVLVKEHTAQAARPHSPIGDEDVLHKEYSETLIRKLETKMSELEQANRQLQADITERKRVEEALRVSERRLHLATKAANVGLWEWDLQTNAVWFSSEWKRQIGYEDHEILNHFETWQSLVHPDDLEPAQARVKAYIKEPWPNFENEFRFRHKDGSYRWILAQASLSPDAQGKLTRVLGSHIDITERKRAEESLRTSREQLRALAARLQSVREEERTRIAREIHDVLAQELTRLKIDLVWLHGRLTNASEAVAPVTLAAQVLEMQQSADASICCVQRIATELRPAVLDSLGLCAAVEWQALDFEKRTGIQCNVNVPDDELHMDRDSATAVFRILQESLTNVLRHARATQLNVLLRQEGDHIILRVEDNGCGIPVETLNNPMAIGLAGMRERALLLHGQLDIWSQPGSQTTVALRLPICQNHNQTA